MDNNDHRNYRKIIHIDMDAFYASIEQRDNPEYRNKPIAVGGPPEGRGGVVATASYEARKFGVRSAMPSKKAQQLCPDLLFVWPRFDVYKEVSGKIRNIFKRYTDLIEPLSLDEAFLDVTQDKLSIGSAMDIAGQIRQAIKEELQLTASAGVSVNKFIAKIASDMNKPDGLTFIGPSRIEPFIAALPVEKFFGVGKVTAAKMKKMGLYTGADIKRLTEADLIKNFGKTGRFYYKIVRGIDDREVQPHREMKSVSAEDTFAYDLTQKEEMFSALDSIADTLLRRLQKHSLYGRTLTVKIRFHDFRLMTRSRSFPEPVRDKAQLAATAHELLLAAGIDDQKIRLLGISVSNFGKQPKERKNNYPGQMSLFQLDADF